MNARQGAAVEWITLHINGERHETAVRAADTLLDTLRNKIGLTGAKRACGDGDCGACTVLVSGRPQHACLSLAAETEGQPVTTIEGLMNSPVQRAFVDHWAIQCGYCTPGFVVNVHALLAEHPEASEETVEEWLQSNVCRCTGYQEIKEAVHALLQLGKTGGK